MIAKVKNIEIDTKVETKDYRNTFVEGMKDFIGSDIEVKPSEKDEWYHGIYDGYIWHKSWLEFHPKFVNASGEEMIESEGCWMFKHPWHTPDILKLEEKNDSIRLEDEIVFEVDEYEEVISPKMPLVETYTYLDCVYCAKCHIKLGIQEDGNGCYREEGTGWKKVPYNIQEHKCEERCEDGGAHSLLEW